VRSAVNLEEVVENGRVTPRRGFSFADLAIETRRPVASALDDATVEIELESSGCVLSPVGLLAPFCRPR
jgi:hypothetical protein